MNKFLVLPAVILIAAPVICAKAENIEKNTARMQAMDKITGRVNVIDIPVGGKIDFGTFSVVVRSCQTRPAEEIPDNFAFVDVSDKDLSGKESNIFKGWMISSSPATNAVEHPIYDVWLLQCLDKKVDKSLLLSKKELDARDTLPMISGADKKTVTSSIAEMSYENETSAPVAKSSEDVTLEFEMDEEAPAENDENAESQNSEDLLTDTFSSEQ